MIAIERLQVADYYSWLGCQTIVAAELGCNQSTVSRRVREAACLADAASAWESIDFLHLERRVHQCWRFAKGRDLRLHAYRWTNHLVKPQLPPSWRINPAQVSVTRRSPLKLLEDHVVDALLAPWPVVAGLDRQLFALVPVYFTPLVLLTSASASLACERGLSPSDIARLSRLERLDFVPAAASACSHHLDEQFFGTSPCPAEQPLRGPQDGPAASRCWGTQLTPLIRPDLTVLPYPMPITYGEFLVCLKPWREHGEIDRLLTGIQRTLMFVRQDRPGLEQLALA